MLGCVIIINITISMTCLYLAVKFWKIGKTIDRATQAILNADRSTYNVLHNAPRAIAKGETGARNVRQQYKTLQNQVQTMNQLLVVLSFLSKFTWRLGVKRRF